MPHTQPTLLATKLFVPRPQGGLVERSRLLEQLDQIPQRRLALVSAPAGFGKTTLVSEWLHQSGMPAAWVSLETAENDPHRFLTYLIAALRGLFPDVGTSAREALAMSTVPPMSSLLPSLINDISSLESDFVVVLDDYHRIENTEVHELIGYLLEHMPPVMHVVLTTRVDPPIQQPVPAWQS